MNADMEHCIRMIEAEEQRARAAPTNEAAEMHNQMIMLYRAQLDRLRRAGFNVIADRARASPFMN